MLTQYIYLHPISKAMDFERMILIVVLCLCLTSIYQVNGTRIISKEEELELERQLKLINKPPVKSIQVLD